jgi:hypothetical protein
MSQQVPRRPIIPLKEALARGFARGTELFGRKGQDQFQNPLRDVGKCAEMFVRQAVVNLQAQYRESPERLEALDTIAQMFVVLQIEALQEQSAAVGNFNKLYGYIKESPLRQEVYTAFCMLFVQTFFCYMFATPALALGLVPWDTSRAADYLGLVNLLAMMPEEDKARAFEGFQRAHQWPSNVDIGMFLKENQDWLALIRADQQARLAAGGDDKKETK